MLELLYILIWQLLQLITEIIEFIYMLIIRLQALLLWSYDFFRGPAARQRSEQNLLANCKAELSKRPNHICVIIAPNYKDVNAEMLSRLFTYALMMDIEHVSVYDTRTPTDGYIDLEKLHLPNCTRDRNGRSIVWCMEVEQPVMVYNQTLVIHPIRESDGQALIAQVCRELHDARSTLQHIERNALTETIHRKLDKHLEFCVDYSEPEMGIIFAHETCTYGMLPWHTRFTEFFKFPNGTYFNAQAFANILYKFGSTNQRWGR